MFKNDIFNNQFLNKSDNTYLKLFLHNKIFFVFLLLICFDDFFNLYYIKRRILFSEEFTFWSRH